MDKIMVLSSEKKTSGCYRLAEGRWTEQKLSLPEEMPLTIFVNGHELVTILCSPSSLNFLVIGYLFSEGLIKEVSDIDILRVCESSQLADVRLKNEVNFNIQKRILTSGCGGGMSLGTAMPKINICSELKITPARIFDLIRKMVKSGSAYRLTGGVHTTVLCDHEQILAMGEDIGRHNTLDKVIGNCMMCEINPKDKILMTTGRIASEILKKAVMLEVPMVVSLSSPTDEAVNLARSLGVTLIGYVRGRNMTVYANGQRLEACQKTEILCASKG